MIKNSKAKTFIGFAIKKGAYAVNVNLIARIKKAYLLVLCSTAGENTRSKTLSLSKKFECDILSMTEGALSELLNKDNAKVIAITDISLAKAIKENSQDGFREGI